MSAIVTSLDKRAALNFGENGHVQHTWDYKTLSEEKVSQFYFQLVRSKDHSELKEMLNDFLSKTMQDTRQGLMWRKTLYKIFINLPSLCTQDTSFLSPAKVKTASFWSSFQT